MSFCHFPNVVHELLLPDHIISEKTCWKFLTFWSLTLAFQKSSEELFTYLWLVHSSASVGCARKYQLNKYSQPGSWVIFYFLGSFRASSSEDSISGNPETTALRRQEEEPGDIEVLQQRAGGLNIKRLLLIKENQITQVKEFSTFLCMGWCKSLGLLKTFLW